MKSNVVFALLASMVPIDPAVQIPSRPPKATAGARQAKNRKKVEDITCMTRQDVRSERRSAQAPERAVFLNSCGKPFGIAYLGQITDPQFMV